MTQQKKKDVSRDRVMARRIAHEVALRGGRTFYVGGCVRDRLMGSESKDIDIEVHGVTPQELEEILGRLGQLTVMGASFGVFGLKGYDLDIAMPRSEHATGRGGHKDFFVQVDPQIGPRGAALRRDFTINAMMEDVLTSEVLDFFGGQEDLKKGIIRHVSDATFGEDPLRAVRAAQFAARFSFAVAPETIAIGASMDLTLLPRERMMGEMEKALCKSRKPSVFFEVLRQMNQLHDWFRELEGEALQSSMDLLDQAAAVRENVSRPLWFMFAALTADLSEGDAKRLITRLTDEHDLLRYVRSMNELHGQPGRLYTAGADTYAYMQLYDESVCPQELLILARICGQEGFPVWQQMLDIYQERMAAPYVMGRDLVEAGASPGPQMGRALKKAHQLRLMGVPKDEALKETLRVYTKDKRG